MIQNTLKIIAFSVLWTITSSAHPLLIPVRGDVTIHTGVSEAMVYIGGEEFGKGADVTDKLKRNGTMQIVIKAPGYKDGFGVLRESDDEVTIKMEKLVYRGESDKYIDISNIRLDVKDNKNIKTINVSSAGPQSEEENKIKEAETKSDEYELKKELKKSGRNQLENPSDDLTLEDTKFSENVYKTLKTTGFIDTVNRVFSDQNNTVVLEGSIRKLFVYHFYKVYGEPGYYKSKMEMRWYIKNSYGEILDSVDTKDYSADFDCNTYHNTLKNTDKMYADAVINAYMRLHREGILTGYIKPVSNFTYNEPLLTINNVKASVSAKEDASIPSVIVKTKDGHGSGFAISQDGYIITNYHVIAGKYKDKPNSVKIVTSTGEEVDGKIVRYNKFRDLALIKVEKTFDKAFKFTNVKSFRNLMDVYTIGAPKSIELGQSFSVGVISSERKSNNNNLLQLGMSVNGGNSGGPLFDASGTLHGVIVAKLIGQNTEGVSFAIPGYLIPEYLNIQYGK